MKMRVTAAWQRLRRSVPLADHLSKAAARYAEDRCARLAAAVTYYGFLSLFPLLLLVSSVIGFLLRDEGARQQRLFAYLSDYVPRNLADRLVEIMSEHAGTAGLLGLVGLVIAGVGWVDTLRESIRAVWHQTATESTLVRKKLMDLLILAGLGLTVLLSVTGSAVATSLATQGSDLLGVASDQGGGQLVLRLLALGLAVLSDVALLSYLLVWLPRTAEPFRRVARAALVGAVLLEVAKYLGIYYFGLIIGRGADLYGVSLAASIGALLWVNLIARCILFTAAWAVTAPYREDVRPSGTAVA